MAGMRPRRACSRSTIAWFLTPEVSLALAAGVDRIGADRPGARPRCRRVALSEVEGLAWLAEAAATAALAAVLVASILQIAGRSYDPFIYFRF